MAEDYASVAGLENEDLFDLIGAYKNQYKDLHNQNVIDYFNGLVKLSKVDIEQNRKTNEEINATNALIYTLNSKLKKLTAIKTLLIILAIAAGAVLVLQITSMTQIGLAGSNTITALASIAAEVVLILLLTRLNPKTKALKEERERLEALVAELTRAAWEQMRPLNELFTPKMCPELFKKTLPFINLDPLFDRKRLDYMVGKFGLSESRDNDRSALFVQSGEINGNPFFICTDRLHKLGTKTYTGSITIHWTTTQYENGKMVTKHHTQTLTASVKKPCPYYSEETYLVYGNEAAPDLIFSRTDSDAERMSQKQIDRHVSRMEKKLQKKAEKSISSDGNFTVMGNSEFEVLFGATNRNNEVQFRLLFTPLAQKQLLELMKETEAGFGDDFNFIKHRMINYIYPQHLSYFKLNITPEYFQGFNFDAIRARFINYNNDYFRHMYFTFAPVLAIPLYRQHKPKEYIYKNVYDSYASFYEHEYIVNNLGTDYLFHPESATPNILKTATVRNEGKSDTVKVSAFGYRTKERVEHISRLGGDGKIHAVPVYWTEYIPVCRETSIVINALDIPEATEYAKRHNEALESIRRDLGTERNIYKVGNCLAYVKD